MMRLIGWSRYGDNLVVQSDFYDLQRETERETERQRQSAQAEFIDDEDDFQPVKRSGTQRNTERDGERKSTTIPTAKIPKRSKNEQRQRETAHTDTRTEREREKLAMQVSPELPDPDWVEEQAQAQRQRQRETERRRNPVAADTEEDSEDDTEAKIENEAAPAASRYGRRPSGTTQQKESVGGETERRETERGQREDKKGPPPLPKRGGVIEGQRETHRETVQEGDRERDGMGEGHRYTHRERPVRVAAHTAMLNRAGSGLHLNKR
eukprot:COSAG03_NODE_1947_length_3314_cov_6.721306_4_plen_266_part_00